MMVLVVPLCSPSVCSSRDPLSIPYPTLLAQAGALLVLLVVLLSVGDAADGAVGRALVGVLLWKFLFLAVAFLLGQNPTEAAPQGTRWRHRESERGILGTNGCSKNKCIMVALAQ